MACPLSTHLPGFATLDALTGLDALCLFVGEDERPLEHLAGHVDWRMCGALSRVIKDRFFLGTAGDWLLLPSAGRVGPARLFAVGVGPRARCDAHVVANALRTAAGVLSRAGMQAVALELPGAGRVADAERARAFSQHFLPAFTGAHVAVLAEPQLAGLLHAPAPTPALALAAASSPSGRMSVRPGDR
jgi:hypothetical protein